MVQSEHIHQWEVGTHMYHISVFLLPSPISPSLDTFLFSKRSLFLFPTICLLFCYLNYLYFGFLLLYKKTHILFNLWSQGAPTFLHDSNLSFLWLTSTPQCTYATFSSENRLLKEKEPTLQPLRSKLFQTDQVRECPAPKWETLFPPKNFLETSFKIFQRRFYKLE